MGKFKVCFAPGRVGQEKCSKQCAECADAERKCTCGAAAGKQRSRWARALCPYHQHTCSADECEQAALEKKRADRLDSAANAIRAALKAYGFDAPRNRAELMVSAVRVLLEEPPRL